MKIIDFYIGFEGEPEIVLISRDEIGNDIVRLKIWIGYFDSIMELIPVDKVKRGEGVLSHYHKHTGWYDDGIWQCEKIEDWESQLNSINLEKLSDNTVKLVFNEILKLILECKECDLQLFFLYD